MNGATENIGDGDFVSRNRGSGNRGYQNIDSGNPGFGNVGDLDSGYRNSRGNPHAGVMDPGGSGGIRAGFFNSATGILIAAMFNSSDAGELSGFGNPGPGLANCGGQNSGGSNSGKDQAGLFRR